MTKAIAVVLGLTLMSLSPHAWQPRPTVRPESVSSMETGVWWQGQPDGAPALPTPPTNPAGDLWVSSTTVSGTIALSAVRFTVGADDHQPVVKIAIDSLTALPSTIPIGTGAAVVACAATSPWKAPAKGTYGALSAAPKYDCAKGQVLGLTSVDGTALIFDLGQFVTDTNKTVSVVLAPAQIPLAVQGAPVTLPVALPGTLIPPTFNATFKPLTASAVEVLTAAPAADEEPATDVAGSSFSDVPRDDTVAAPFFATTPAEDAPKSTGIAAVPRQLAQVATKVMPDDLAKHERTAAAAIFLLLCVWAFIIFNQDPVPGVKVKQRGRPYRTLYDGAPSSLSKLKRPSLSARTGKPPTLR